MADYLLTNITISIIAFCAIALLRNAPARTRFYLAITALLAWFVPWHLLSTVTVFSTSISPITDEVFQSFFWLDNSNIDTTKVLTSSVVESSVTQVSFFDGFAERFLTLNSFFILVTTIGLLLFIKDLVNYYLNIQRWVSQSEKENSLWQTHSFPNTNITIRLLDEGGPGMATGIIKPIIWLNKNYRNCTTTKTILTHELNHIAQHDTIWIWFINLAQRLFWWNPLVRIITSSAHEQMELSCDERCNQQLKAKYVSDLAEILLNEAHSNNKHVAVATIKNSKNFNVKRIEKLTKENTMKKKYLVLMMGAFSMISFVGLAVNNGNTPSIAQNTVTENQLDQTKKIELYNENALHNTLVDELLQITQQAKSKDKQVLSEILLNLEAWNTNRPTSSDASSEMRLKIMSFSMICYLLDNLNRVNEIPAAYTVMFPNKPIEDAMFLKNHIAKAYIKMGLATNAIDLLNSLVEQQIKNKGYAKSGTLMLLAHAYLADKNYDAVIETANKMSSSNEKRGLLILHSAYVKMDDIAKVDETKRTLQNTYNIKPMEPKLGGFSSPILTYLAK